MKNKLFFLITVVAVAASFVGCTVPQNNGEKSGYDKPNESNVTEPSGFSSADAEDEQIEKLKEKSSAYDVPYVFESEDALIKAVTSKDNNVEETVSLEEYYRPRNIPKDISLAYILVKNTYVAIRYDYYADAKNSANSGTYFLIEWYRTFSKGDLIEEVYRIYPSDQIVVHNQYYIIKAGVVQDVFWEQEGLAFHAVVPSNISMGELAAFCDSEAVKIR